MAGRDAAPAVTQTSLIDIHFSINVRA